MDDDAGAQAPQLLWINWTDQVVSFHREEGLEPVAFPDHDAMREEGLEPVAFPDHDAMLAYVFQKTSNGFRIQ